MTPRSSHVSVDTADSSSEETQTTSALVPMDRTPSRAERKSLALDAASMGRLSRLPEHVVEAVAMTEEKEEGAEWKLKRAMQTQVLKSSFIRCIQEAAAVGLVKRLEPVEIVSNRHSDQKHDESTNTKENSPNRPPRGRRAFGLLENHVRRSREAKARSWSSNAAMLEAFEQQDQVRSSWHATTTSTGTSTSPLPSPVVPRWRRRFNGMTPEKQRECVALEAANRAFDRIWRLENEFDRELMIREGCSCIYCSSSPSSYQTQEYQRMSKDPTYFPPPMDLQEDDEGGDEETIKRELPSPVIPTLATLYGSSPASAEAVKQAMDQILPQVATKAWDRALKLQKKGQAHLITDRCSCVYCGTASPRQTRHYKRLEGRTNREMSAVIPPPPVSSAPPPKATKGQHAPRSLTPPPPSSAQTVFARGNEPKRSTSAPATTSPTSKIRSVAQQYNKKKGAVMPSWVSPLVNRKYINYQQQQKYTFAPTTPTSSQKVVSAHASPAGVTSVHGLDAPPLFRDGDEEDHHSKNFSAERRTKHSLDGDIDEEEILWGNLSSIVVPRL